MTIAKYRHRLPQEGETRHLTDGGIETADTFHEGLDLPSFAAFTLLRSAEGRAALTYYLERHTVVTQEPLSGFILDNAARRACSDWGDLLGLSVSELASENRAAIALLLELRDKFEAAEPFVNSGNISPRGDGYAAEADGYHNEQVVTLEAAGVDMISAITMTDGAEAEGIGQASARLGVPLALSFTLKTDRRLPSGLPLGEAIADRCMPLPVA